jgi:hypothetical protein
MSANFFEPLMDKTFNLNFLGNFLLNRKISARYRRIYVGRKVFNELKAGDVLICYKNHQGNIVIEKKSDKKQ